MRPGVDQPKAGGALERNPWRGADGVAATARAAVSRIDTTLSCVVAASDGIHGASCNNAQIAHVEGSWNATPVPSDSCDGATATC